MSAVGYASIPVTLSFANAAKAVQSQLKPQLDKLSKDAAAGIDKNVGSAAEQAAKKVKRARENEEKATKAVIRAKQDEERQSEKVVKAKNAEEAAERNLARAREDASGKAAAAEEKLNKVRGDSQATTQQIAEAEREYQRALQDIEANIVKKTDALADARGRVMVETRKLEDAETNASRAQQKAEEASERVTAALKQQDEHQQLATRSGRDLAGMMDSMRDAAGRAAGKIGDFAQKHQVQAGIIAGGIGALGKNMADYASEAEQSYGAVESIFAGHADQIVAKSQEAATQVGLSGHEYRELASTTGAMLKNMGMPMEDVSGKTQDLVALGADLAATFGGPTKDAVDAIGSLLRGEADPIERYGVSIKKADVNARLAAKGLSGLEGEALKQVEAQELLAMLTEQTADAQGQFARETDTAAHKQQVATAAIDDAREKIGTLLLPIMAEAMEKAAQVAGVIAEHPQLFAAIAAAIGGLAGSVVVIAQVTKAVEGLSLAFKVLGPALTGPWGPLIAALTAVVGALTWFFTKTETGQRLWAQFTEFLQTAFQSASDAVVGAITWLIVKWNEAQQVWDAVSAAMRAAADWLRDKFHEIITSIVLKFIEWQNNVNQVISVIKGYFQGFADKVRSTSSQAVDEVRRIPDRIKSAFSGAGSWLVDSGRRMIQGLIDGIQSMAGRVGDAVRWIVPDSMERFVPGLHFGGVVPGFAGGGVLPDVPGIPRSVRDPILGVDGGGVPVARVEPGEFIVNREDTKKHLPLLRAINSGRINPAQGDLGLPRYANGGVVSAQDMLNFALGKTVNGYRASRPLQSAPYVFGGSNWGDCSGTTSAFAALAIGMNPFPRKYYTGNQGPWLSSHGFSRGIGPRKDSYAVSFYNGGPGGGHTAASIFDSNGNETKIEMGGYPSEGHFNTGVGAGHSSFTDRYHIPLKSAAAQAIAAGDVVSTSVDGVTVAAPEKSLRQAKTYQIDWGTASQLASKYDTDTHRDAALRQYLGRKAKVYDTGGILPTGGVAVNLGKPELIFPAEATTAMLQMARQTPQFAQAMEQLSAAAPELAAAVDKFTDLDYGVIAEEVTAAWRNEDFGYGELARAVGEEAAERIVTEIAFIGDQIRDMQDGSNMRAYLANMKASEAVGLADRAGQLVGIQSIGSTFGGVAKGYEALQDAAVMQVDAADAVTQAEKNLTDARREYAEMLKEAGGDPEVSVKTTRKIEDAERKLKEAKEAPRAKNDKDGSAQAKKIADAERKLARVREDAAAELEKNGVKNADELVKASEAVTAAEQEREKALGTVKMAAQATGQAQIAMALQVAEMVIGIGKKIWDVVVKITDWINNIRIQTRTAVWELTKSWSELTGVVDQHRGMVAQLQMQLVNAALDVIGKSMEMRTAQVDVVRAQLQGAKNVAEAEAALQEARDEAAGRQKWNFRDMSLEYDRFRDGYRLGMSEQIAGMTHLSEQERERIRSTMTGVGLLSDEERGRVFDAVAGMTDLTVEERERINAALAGVGELTVEERARVANAIAGMSGLSAEERERIIRAINGVSEVAQEERLRVVAALTGIGSIHGKQQDLTNQIVANADREGLAAKLGLDAKLAAQKAADDAYVASVNGREVGERELHQMYKLQLAEQLVGEQAFQNLKDASLDAQLEWQRRVDKAAQLGLKHELEARAAVTPEILALQREVYAAEFAQQKSILDAQIKGIEATFAQQKALVAMGRLQEDLVRQQAELDRLSGQTMGMNQGQAIVMEEIARLQKENAEILGKRNSAAAGARNFFGRMFDWNGDGNGGRNTWSVERKQYDAQIAANNRQIAELQKSVYAEGAFTPAQQREIDKATKLAAKYYAQGNEAAAKAALAASPLGNAQRSLEVNQTLSRITDWESRQRELQREQQDMLAEFKVQKRLFPLRWRSQELESRESAQRYAADALRSDNDGVRDALATLSQLEESNAAELKQLREKPTVVNVTVPGPRDGVTTIGEMEDALVALAGELGVTRTDVKRLNEARRTSASDRVRAAIGR